MANLVLTNLYRLPLWKILDDGTLEEKELIDQPPICIATRRDTVLYQHAIVEEELTDGN